ncbi:PspA/IM30 family protein [Maricaulis maris]|jgi:phage shock protein A|uniref:PspA/IM30 family protein n=1 Tax=Maricaulis maris TaxID=74318 RepID=UPI0026F0E0DD|nr:PspA/IM30 family protein [Maricaulis maris]
MFTTLVALFRARSESSRQKLETENAALLIEQKIREAEQGHDIAKRSLAGLILRERQEDTAQKALAARRQDMENRTRDALKSGMEELAGDGANALADLDNEHAARADALARTRAGARRLRLLLEKTERRLTDLRQGLITARALEDERRGGTALQGSLGGLGALMEGEAVLKRALAAPNTGDFADILDDINADLSGDDLVDRMADQGFGAAVKARGDDILKRIRAGLDTAPPAAHPA